MNIYVRCFYVKIILIMIIEFLSQNNIYIDLYNLTYINTIIQFNIINMQMAQACLLIRSIFKNN